MASGEKTWVQYNDSDFGVAGNIITVAAAMQAFLNNGYKILTVVTQDLAGTLDHVYVVASKNGITEPANPT